MGTDQSGALMPALATALALVLAGVSIAMSQPPAGRLLFAESFEDESWQERGWYDGPRFETTPDTTAPEGRRVGLWRWRAEGDIAPTGGSARLLLPPQEDVLLSVALRLGPQWRWTGVGYHPHMFSFLTDADPAYVGPAYTHLTTYVEIVDGVPRLSLQDGRNVDTTRIGQSLSGETEERAIAGCNGAADRYGEGDCYSRGDAWFNGKSWVAAGPVFDPAGQAGVPSPWRRMVARFRLNSVRDGVARADGILQMWFDGQLIIDVDDAVLRTGAHASMRFNQLFVGPYIGPGVQHPQQIWIDDLRIYAVDPASTAVEGASWGHVKVRRP